MTLPTDKVLALAERSGMKLDLNDNDDAEIITLMQIKLFAALIQLEMEADGYRKCAEGQGTTQFCAMAEELRKDAERLDWIDSLKSSGFDHTGYGDYRYYVHGEGYPKVREVIDRARSANE